MRQSRKAVLLEGMNLDQTMHMMIVSGIAMERTRAYPDSGGTIRAPAASRQAK
jgi:hypothetical protein